MRFGRVALLAAVAVFAAACTSDADPGASDTPSATPTTSVTTSTPATSSSAKPSPSVPTTGPNVRRGEKPPKLSAAGHENTTLGASDFTLFWFQTLDWAYATTDSTLARRQFAASCTGCARFLRNMIDSTKKAGQHFSGGRLVAFERAVADNDGHLGSTQVIDALIQQSPLRVLTRAGKTVDTADGTKRTLFRTWLAWREDHWTVVDWKRDSG